MVVVAISGVGMAVVTEGSRRLNKGVTTRAPFILPIQPQCAADSKSPASS